MAGGGKYTVIPHVATGHLSGRLVPGQDPDAVIAAITAHVEAQAPAGVRVQVRPDEARVPAYTIPASHPAIRAATAALEAVYPGQPVLHAKIGGTLPATDLFERTLGCKTLFFSFSTSDENLHAPNEYLRTGPAARGHARLGAAVAAAGLRAVPPRRRNMTDAPYTAYSYLRAGEDYPCFDLAPEFGRVPPYAAELTEAERGRAAGLLRDSLVISLHDHPVRFPHDMTQTPAYNRTGRQHAAYAGLRASGLTVLFDNLMDGTACVTGNAPWRWNDIITDLGMRQADLAHQDHVMVVRTLADIDEGVPVRGGSGWSSGWRRPPRSRTRSTGWTSSTAWACGRSASPTPTPTRWAAGSTR